MKFTYIAVAALLSIISGNLWAISIGDLFIVDRVDSSGYVYIKKEMTNDMRIKNTLIQNYPLYAFTATLNANAVSSFPILTTKSDSLLQIKNRMMIFGAGESRKINFTMISCNDNPIAVTNFYKLGKAKRNAAQGYSTNDIKEAVKIYKGAYQLSLPYGHNNDEARIIEIHNKLDDKVVVIAQNYDAVESTARYFADSLLSGLLGSKSAAFDTIYDLLEAIEARNGFGMSVAQAKRQAIANCEDSSGGSQMVGLACSSASDSFVQYEIIKLLSRNICDSSL